MQTLWNRFSGISIYYDIQYFIMVVKNNVTFSIITPVYNGERFVEDTIKSVLNCTDGISFEYIVVDDGSTDSTPKILREYSNRIKVISQENIGEAGAVNSGLNRARGRYCLIISGDDLLISNELFINALRLFDENPLLGVVYPDWQIINNNGEIKKYVETKEFSQFELLGRFNCLPGPGSIFKRDLAVSIGGRNPNFRYVSDYDFWLRMNEVADFKRLHGFYAQWRNHDDSTSVLNRGMQMSSERIEVIYKHLMQFPKPKALERSAKSAALYNAAILAYFSKTVPGRKLIFRAIAIGRMRIPGAKIKIVLYLVLLPISRFALSWLTQMPTFKKLVSK